MHLTISFHEEKLYIWLFIIQIDTFGKWLRLSAKSLLSKTEKNSDIWANSDNLSLVKPLHWAGWHTQVQPGLKSGICLLLQGLFTGPLPFLHRGCSNAKRIKIRQQKNIWRQQWRVTVQVERDRQTVQRQACVEAIQNRILFGGETKGGDRDTLTDRFFTNLL